MTSKYITLPNPPPFFLFLCQLFSLSPVLGHFAPPSSIHVWASMHVDILYICNINAPWAEKETSHLSTVMWHHCSKHTLHSDVKNLMRGCMEREQEWLTLVCWSMLYHAKPASFEILHAERKDIWAGETMQSKAYGVTRLLAALPLPLQLPLVLFVLLSLRFAPHPQPFSYRGRFL